MGSVINAEKQKKYHSDDLEVDYISGNNSVIETIGKEFNIFNRKRPYKTNGICVLHALNLYLFLVKNVPQKNSVVDLLPHGSRLEPSGPLEYAFPLLTLTTCGLVHIPEVS